MRYWPNPAHKGATSEGGPPRWGPHKAKCPPMSVEERERLMAESIAEDEAVAGSTRYALRIGPSGLEWFAGCLTRLVEGEPEFHGYPCVHVPIRVLRRFRDLGKITPAQYEKLRKVLP